MLRLGAGSVFVLIIFLLGRSQEQHLKTVDIDEIDHYLAKANDATLQPAVSLKYANQAYFLIKKMQNDSVRIINLFKVANRYYNNSHFDEYKIITIETLSDATKLNNKFFIAKAHLYLGDYFQETVKHDSAFFHYRKAERLFNNNESGKFLATAKIGIAESFYYLGDFYRSEDKALEALQILRTHIDRNFEYEAFILLGIDANARYENDIALKYLYKALDVQNKYNLAETSKSVTFNNIGNTYQQMGKLKTSILYFERAVQENKKDNLLLKAIIVDNIAYSKFKLGHRSIEIPQLFITSIDIKAKLKHYSTAAFSQTRLAEYYFTANQKIQSIRHAREALQIAEEYGDKKVTLLALKQLISSDPTNAADYSKKYIAISDSLQLEERRIRNKFARIEYETDEIEIEKDKAIKDKSIFVTASSIALGFLTLLFVIYRQKYRQRALRFQQDQHFANEDIYQLLLVQQNKVMEGRQFEKNRISRELHDGVMNQLTSTRLNLHVLTKKPNQETVEKCLPYIDGLKDIEDEVRNISHDLHKEFASGVDTFTLMVESLIDEQRTISDAQFYLEIDSSINWDKVSGTCKINIFRILQESLQNIHKHAQAAHISISFKIVDDKLVTEITDDGKGYEVDKIKSGIGIKNIRKRAEYLGGYVDIQSVSGKGVEIKLFIPM